MKESTDNGVDFEMQELERLQYENLRKKYLKKAVDGYEYWDYYSMNTEERRLRDKMQNLKYPTILVEEDDYDRYKRSQEWRKFQQQRQIDKNNLK